MLWLRPKLMARALKEGSVPDRERLLCFTACAVGPIVFGGSEPADVPRLLANANTVVTAGLTLTGIIWCFRSLRPVNRVCFADHFICLLVPVGMTFFLPFYFIPALVLLFALPDESAAWKILIPLGWVVLSAIFWRLRRLLPESMAD